MILINETNGTNSFGLSPVCFDLNFEKNLYDQVYSQYYRIMAVYVVFILYMTVLNILVKFKKIDYKEFNKLNYYGYVGLLTVTFLWLGMWGVLHL